MLEVLPLILLTVRLTTRGRRAQKRERTKEETDRRRARGDFVDVLLPLPPPDPQSSSSSSDPTSSSCFSSQKRININTQPLSTTPPKYHHPRLLVNKALSTTPPRPKKEKEKNQRKTIKAKLCSERKEQKLIPSHGAILCPTVTPTIIWFPIKWLLNYNDYYW